MFWYSSQQILSGCCQIGTVGGQPFSCLGERFIEMSGLWKACWRTLLCRLTFVLGVIVSSGGEPPSAHSVVLSVQVLVKYIVIRCPLILTGFPVPATDTSPKKSPDWFCWDRCPSGIFFNSWSLAGVTIMLLVLTQSCNKMGDRDAAANP